MKGSLRSALTCSPELVCGVGVCDGKEATHHLPQLLCAPLWVTAQKAAGAKSSSTCVTRGVTDVAVLVVIERVSFCVLGSQPTWQ